MTHPSWTLGTFLRTLCHKGMPHFENNYATRGAPIVSRNVLRDFSDRSHLNWSSFARIRQIWPCKIIIQVVLSAPAARTPVDHGATGILALTHGGPRLDGSDQERAL